MINDLWCVCFGICYEWENNCLHEGQDNVQSYLLFSFFFAWYDFCILCKKKNTAAWEVVVFGL